MQGKPSSETQQEISELTFDEMIRARQVFLRHTDEYLTTEFDLRTILSELGQYPSDGELKFCMEAFGGKMGFNGFTTYLTFLKRRFKQPEPKDLDTLRAFVALGGGQDRQGDINAENLRNACRHFDLTIDIDAMIREVDTDNSGKLEFEEFRSMWGAAVLPRSDSISSEDSSTAAALAALAAAGAAAISPPPPESDEGTEEDHIEALRQYLFPQANRAANGSGGPAGRKATTKRQSTLVVPKAPTLNFSTKEGADGAGAAQSSAAAGGKHDSDSEEAETPSYQRNQYRPPSPVILSMRTSGRSSQKNNGFSTSTPRGGATMTKGALVSPRGTATQRTVSPRQKTRK